MYLRKNPMLRQLLLKALPLRSIPAHMSPSLDIPRSYPFRFVTLSLSHRRIWVLHCRELGDQNFWFRLEYRCANLQYVTYTAVTTSEPPILQESQTTLPQSWIFRCAVIPKNLCFSFLKQQKIVHSPRCDKDKEYYGDVVLPTILTQVT